MTPATDRRNGSLASRSSGRSPRAALGSGAERWNVWPPWEGGRQRLDDTGSGTILSTVKAITVRWQTYSHYQMATLERNYSKRTTTSSHGVFCTVFGRASRWREWWFVTATRMQLHGKWQNCGKFPLDCILCNRSSSHRAMFSHSNISENCETAFASL